MGLMITGKPFSGRISTGQAGNRLSKQVPYSAIDQIRNRTRVNEYDFNNVRGRVVAYALAAKHSPCCASRWAHGRALTPVTILP